MHGRQNEVGRLDVRPSEVIRLRSPINHSKVELACYGLHVAVDDGCSIKPDYRDWIFFLYGRPVAGAALGIGIDQEHVCTIKLECAGQMSGNRGLSRAAFLVEYGNNLHINSLELMFIYSFEVNGTSSSAQYSHTY